MKEYWDRIIKFFAVWDFPTILQALRQLDPKEVARNPLVWAIGVPVLALMVWRKMFRVLLLLCSFGLFLLLLQATVGSPGEGMPLRDVLSFVGGSLVLLVVNLYFLLMRD